MIWNTPPTAGGTGNHILPTIAIHNEGDEDHLDDEACVVAIDKDVSHDGPGLESNVQEDERSLPLHVGVHHLAAPPALQQAQDPALCVQGRVKKFCCAAAALIYRLRATMHAHFKAHCFFKNCSLFFKGSVLLLLFLYHY